jgi:hypothetical protein
VCNVSAHSPLDRCHLPSSDDSRSLLVRRCDQMCPSNVLSTITDLKDAIWEDILTVVRLVASCFGNHGTPALVSTALPLPVLTCCLFIPQASGVAFASSSAPWSRSGAVFPPARLFGVKMVTPSSS